ncbi:MAG: dual specificity protein phosphatase family protein [Ktedonobacteraceae bacterium]|nr:dual specificity protein phosphatase family protein [Ktedonobacteraceae bacterium]
MSSEQVPPPPAEEASPTTPPTTSEVSIEETGTVPVAPELPHVPFSYARWASTGITRLLYRGWTRVAVRLFPENSASEYIARTLHIPLPDALNLSWVNAHLAVGGRIRPEDIKAVAQVGITHVVDTRSEYSDDKDALAKEHIDLLYLPTPDTYPLSVEQLMQGSEWTDKCIREGGRVLIHCEHGVGRSVLLTCAVLVYQGMNARDALELVKKMRWQASPNQRQVNRLREFEALLSSRPTPNA